MALIIKFPWYIDVSYMDKPHARIPLVRVISLIYRDDLIMKNVTVFIICKVLGGTQFYCKIWNPYQSLGFFFIALYGDLVTSVSI